MAAFILNASFSVVPTSTSDGPCPSNSDDGAALLLTQRHVHSSLMQHALHMSTQEPSNPLGMSTSSSSIEPPLIAWLARCEVVSTSLSALLSKFSPPAKGTHFDIITGYRSCPMDWMYKIHAKHTHQKQLRTSVAGTNTVAVSAELKTAQKQWNQQVSTQTASSS